MPRKLKGLCNPSSRQKPISTSQNPGDCTWESSAQQKPGRVPLACAGADLRVNEGKSLQKSSIILHG